MNKTILLERLQNERDQFEHLLNRIGFARQLTMRGVVGGLTVKDLVAEVFAHEQFIADRLSEILHDETYAPSASFTALDIFQNEYGYPDYESPLIEKDKHDLFVVDSYKNIEFDEIVSQELAVYANILQALEKLTHHQLLDHDLFHRVAEHTYRPYRRTSILIQRWLKRIASEPK
jgi:AAA+ superfamily predicted ATPase